MRGSNAVSEGERLHGLISEDIALLNSALKASMKPLKSNAVTHVMHAEQDEAIVYVFISPSEIHEAPEAARNDSNESLYESSSGVVKRPEPHGMTGVRYIRLSNTVSAGIKRRLSLL